MKKMMLITVLAGQLLAASSAFASGVGVIIDRGGVSIGIGIGRGPGHGPGYGPGWGPGHGGHHRPRGWVCTAENLRGMTFNGRGFSRYEAESRALDNCYRFGSRKCFVRQYSCEPIFGRGF